MHGSLNDGDIEMGGLNEPDLAFGLGDDQRIEDIDMNVGDDSFAAGSVNGSVKRVCTVIAEDFVFLANLTVQSLRRR